MSPNQDVATAQALGQLTGELRVMHQSLTNALDVIRDDLKRSEAAQNSRLTRLEENINGRLDKVDGQIVALQNEDKRIIERVSKNSVIGGSITAALVNGLIELLKHY